MDLISPSVSGVCDDEFELILDLADARSNLNLCSQVLV